MKLPIPNFKSGTCIPILFLTISLSTTGINAQYDPNFRLRVNVGGPLLNYQGQEFIADQYATNGTPYTNSDALVDELFKTERYSTSGRQLNFEIPLENGDYKVILYFAEIYYGATGGAAGGPGKRIFDVRLEGGLEIDNLDINAEVGAETPLIKIFDNVSISDSSLNILLSAALADGGVDYPKLSAFEIHGIDNTNTGSYWSQNTDGIYYEIGNIGMGTAPQSAYRLAVNGKIHAKEVKVDLDNWPDYVFGKNYDLPSLEEIERHIQEYGHLMNVPSADEVRTNGIELGEMDRLLMEKIEELTLYIIEQDEIQKQLEKRIKLLEENK